MEISSVNNAVSLLRDSLTSPFTEKKVTINAHTPFDEPEETEQEAYSRSYFNQRQFAQIRYAMPNYDTCLYELKSPANIIENSISGGISPIDAVKIYKAMKTYKLNELTNNVDVKRLGPEHRI